MRRKWIPTLAVVFGIVLLSGAMWVVDSNFNAPRSINLECAADASCPFEQKTFTTKEDLKKFRHAMGTADKIKGDLDVAPMFWMSVAYKNGTVKKYVFNIGENKGGILLRNVRKNNYYSISQQQADILRPLIYNE